MQKKNQYAHKSIEQREYFFLNFFESGVDGIYYDKLPILKAVSIKKKVKMLNLLPRTIPYKLYVLKNTCTSLHQIEKLHIY